MEQHYCLICNKQIRNKHLNFAQNNICGACISKMIFVYKNFKIDSHNCLAIYRYNDFMREIIYRIKAQGDKKLAIALISPIISFLRTKYKNFTIIPMPSSINSDKKRGFNHVEEMFSLMGLKMVKAFAKKDNYKQSNQSKFHRKDVESHMIFYGNLINIKEKYLLVDDITTTHKTLSFAAKKLSELGVNRIEILVLCIKEKENEKRKSKMV